MSAILQLPNSGEVKVLPTPGTPPNKPLPRLCLQWHEDLMWGPISAKTMTYKEALAYVDILHLDGIFCWRIPTLEEVMNLGGDPTGIEYPWSEYAGKRRGNLWATATFCQCCQAKSPGLDHLAVCLKCGEIWETPADKRCYVMPVRDVILDATSYYKYQRTIEDPEGEKKKPEGPRKVISLQSHATSSCMNSGEAKATQ